MGNLNLGAGQIKADQWINNDGTENFKCRAWVNFNGTGTVAIRSSGNVLSITDNGVGDYTLNFTNAILDANYSSIGSAGLGALVVQIPRVSAPTTTALRIGTLVSNTAATADADYVSIGIYR